jgi:hypothetical protein
MPARSRIGAAGRQQRGQGRGAAARGPGIRPVRHHLGLAPLRLVTEWERTRDTRWRDRIVAGMRSIAAMPQHWFVGGAPMELKTGAFVGPGTQVSISHLNGVFGVFEMHAELLELIDEPAYRECLARLLRLLQRLRRGSSAGQDRPARFGARAARGAFAVHRLCRGPAQGSGAGQAGLERIPRSG